MRLKTAASILALVTVAGWTQSAAAAVVFSDNFNSYAYQLNWAPPANWAVTAGSVDLIGATTTTTDYNFFPGNGGFVDLDGTSNSPGTLGTIDTFAAGEYTLTFDLGGNDRGDGSKTTDFSLGSFSGSLSLAATAPLTLETYTFFTTTGGNLVFSDLPGGNQDIGNILDNVTLVSDVPEPSTWAMFLLGFGAIGWTVRNQRRRSVQVA